MRGSREMSLPVTAATLTSIVVFVPLVFTANTSFGRFLRDFGVSIMVALVASLVVSLTLVPLIASKLLRKPLAAAPGFIIALRRWYAAGMRWTLDHRLVTLTVTGAVLVGGITVAPDELFVSGSAAASRVSRFSCVALTALCCRFTQMTSPANWPALRGFWT